MKVYTDEGRIFQDNSNGSYGNKILHLFFVINLAERHGRKPIMHLGSNLDEIFEPRYFVERQRHVNQKYIYSERDPFYFNNSLLKILGLSNRIQATKLQSILKNDKKEFYRALKFLKKDPPDYNFSIKGIFFHYDLMPSYETISNYLTIRDDLIRKAKEKYPSLTNDKSVAVHYRGTDFNFHLNHVFPEGISLPVIYYKKAILEIESILGTDLHYHIFSDDIDFIKEVFKDKNVNIHRDSPALDWVGIFLASNVIQSNSSFCWTASLYNKSISIQPEGGYNFKLNSGTIPFGFNHKNSILIKCTNERSNMGN